MDKSDTSITVHDSYPDLAEAMLAFKRASDQHQKEAAFEHLRQLASDSVIDYASSLVNGVRSTLLHKSFSSHCDDWLQKTFGVSVDDVKSGLRNADIQVGNGSLVQMIEMVKNRPEVLDAQKRVLGGMTVAQFLENNPSTSAVGELGGNRIYVNAMSVAQLGEGFFAGTLIHEVIHNLTSKFDHEIQDSMGVGYAGGSRNITNGILNNCMYK